MWLTDWLSKRRNGDAAVRGASTARASHPHEVDMTARGQHEMAKTRIRPWSHSRTPNRNESDVAQPLCLRPIDKDNRGHDRVSAAARPARREVLVVGGGAVAARRVPPLVAAGARVTVVAPQVTPAASDSGALVQRRVFDDSDLDGVWLVHRLHRRPGGQRAGRRGAAARQVFCVRADAADGGSARTPAVLRRDD